MPGTLFVFILRLPIAETNPYSHIYQCHELKMLIVMANLEHIYVKIRYNTPTELDTISKKYY